MKVESRQPNPADLIRNPRLDEIKIRRSEITNLPWKPRSSVLMINLNKEEILINNKEQMLKDYPANIVDDLANIQALRMEASRLHLKGSAQVQDGNKENNILTEIDGHNKRAVSEFIFAQAQSLSDNIKNQHPLPENSPKDHKRSFSNLNE